MTERWVQAPSTLCKRSRYDKHQWRIPDYDDLTTTVCGLCGKRAYILVTEEAADV